MWTVVLGGVLCTAQTRVNLGSQGQNVDFSNAVFTRPIRVSSSLPATCITGDVTLLNSAPGNSRIYVCTSTNSWTAQNGGLPGAGDVGQLLGQSVNGLAWYTLGGDLLGLPNSMVVRRLQSRPVSAAVPADQQVLRWNAVANEWQPGSLTSGATPATCDPSNNQGSLQVPLGCTVLLSGTAYVLSANASVTGLSGTGSIWFELSATGVFTARHNLLAASCVHCVTQAGVNGFSATGRPIASAAVNNGVLGALVSWERVPSAQPLEAGENITIATIDGRQRIAAQRAVATGTAAPPATGCDEASEVGLLYARAGDPATVPVQMSRCAPTGANSYGWQPVGHGVGTAPPAACATGDLFLIPDEQPDRRWLACTAPDTWAPLTGAATGLSKPVCDATQRARFWHTPGDTGTADTLEWCGRNASGAYEWRVVN